MHPLLLLLLLEGAMGIPFCPDGSAYYYDADADWCENDGKVLVVEYDDYVCCGPPPTDPLPPPAPSPRSVPAHMNAPRQAEKTTKATSAAANSKDSRKIKRKEKASDIVYYLTVLGGVVFVVVVVVAVYFACCRQRTTVVKGEERQADITDAESISERRNNKQAGSREQGRPLINKGAPSSSSENTESAVVMEA